MKELTQQVVALTYGTFYSTFEPMLPSVQLSSSSYQFLALRLTQDRAKERGPEEFNERVLIIQFLPEADVVEGLVVNTVGLIGVLDQLMDGEGGVVGLHHSVRHLKMNLAYS